MRRNTMAAAAAAWLAALLLAGGFAAADPGLIPQSAEKQAQGSVNQGRLQIGRAHV